MVNGWAGAAGPRCISSASPELPQLRACCILCRFADVVPGPGAYDPQVQSDGPSFSIGARLAEKAGAVLKTRLRADVPPVSRAFVFLWFGLWETRCKTRFVRLQATVRDPGSTWSPSRPKPRRSPWRRDCRPRKVLLMLSSAEAWGMLHLVCFAVRAWCVIAAADGPGPGAYEVCGETDGPAFSMGSRHASAAGAYASTTRGLLLSPLCGTVRTVPDDCSRFARQLWLGVILRRHHAGARDIRLPRRR